jgi:uncharacterized membrane protein
MTTDRVLALAAGIGVVAGLRAMTAPAAVSVVAHRNALPLGHSKLHFLQSTASASLTTVAALGELVTDKLPSTPNRTDPPSLAARIVSGAVCGAAFAASAKRSITAGALVGGLGAIAGTFAGYELRRRIRTEFDVPDLPVALAEDAIAIGSAAALVSQFQR